MSGGRVNAPRVVRPKITVDPRERREFRSTGERDTNSPGPREGAGGWDTPRIRYECEREARLGQRWACGRRATEGF